MYWSVLCSEEPVMARMCTRFYLAVTLALSALLVTGQVQQQLEQIGVEPVSDLCLGCICEAASNCNRTLNCQGEVCGLFRITKPYWLDSNRPVIPLDDPNTIGAYERCTSDAVCAAEAVKNYMARFAQDCNRDGVINCIDYASIHRLGGYGCSGGIEPEYWNRFNYCQQQFSNNSPSIDVRGGKPPADAF